MDMEFENVSVMSIAHSVPPHRISSEWIDEQLSKTMTRLGVHKGLLEQLSGIVARRFWDEGVQPSDVAAMAARKAMASAGVNPDQIGLLINTSVCRDWIEPSTACIVHGKLGLSSDCISYDLGNACLAFMNGMDSAAHLIETGQIEYALVVNGEGSRHVIDQTMKRMTQEDCTEEQFRAEFAALTLGSGAVAMVLSRADLAPEGHRYLRSVNQAATEWSHLCRGTTEQMFTDTRTLLVEGLKLARQTWERAWKLFGWSADRFDQFVLHQVSRVHTDQLCATLGIDSDRCFKIYPEWGNVGPAGVPLTLSMAVEAGQIKRGDRVALLGIGSGLNCAMSELVW
jgi:3-oxoacyl-[acyl-carrier-protein] synthase-3